MQVEETQQKQEKTLRQYNHQLAICEEIFLKKSQDYGTSWRVMRPKSITDQLYIKAQRIRTLEETGVSKVGDGVEDEFRALVNYGAMALIQLEQGYEVNLELTPEQAKHLYEESISVVRDVMLKKNHDYGEAWRTMRVSSFTDLILTKILRIKQIEDNKGETIISEGFDGHYTDIINYSLFALIRLNE